MCELRFGPDHEGRLRHARRDHHRGRQIATAVNGNAIAGGAITVTIAGAAAGQLFSAAPTAAREVNEDDVISFTPSGASGATVGAQMFAVIRRA